MSLTSFARYQPRNGAGQFIAAKVTAAVERSMTVWAERVLRTAQGIVPVRTGDLRDSGHTVVANSGKLVDIAVVFDSPHAAFVEFGTGIRGAASPGAGDVEYSTTWPGMPAQPYLRPAFEAERLNAEPLVREYVGVALKA